MTELIMRFIILGQIPGTDLTYGLSDLLAVLASTVSLALITQNIKEFSRRTGSVVAYLRTLHTVTASRRDPIQRA